MKPVVLKTAEYVQEIRALKIVDVDLNDKIIL